MSKNIISPELVGRKVNILFMHRYEMVGEVTDYKVVTSGSKDDLFEFTDEVITVEALDKGRNHVWTFSLVDEKGRMDDYLVTAQLVTELIRKEGQA